MAPRIPPDARDPAILQRTARLLGDRDSALVGVLQSRDSLAGLNVVEVRAIVVRLRAMMMDATFDDTHIAADISETSEMYEWWRQHLSRIG